MAVLDKLGKETKCDLIATKMRANYLHSKKFGVGDAAHIAVAEATSDFFITCDDKLVKKCRKEKTRIIAMNPLEFCISEDLT